MARYGWAAGALAPLLPLRTMASWTGPRCGGESGADTVSSVGAFGTRSPRGPARPARDRAAPGAGPATGTRRLRRRPAGPRAARRRRASRRPGGAARRTRPPRRGDRTSAPARRRRSPGGPPGGRRPRPAPGGPSPGPRAPDGPPPAAGRPSGGALASSRTSSASDQRSATTRPGSPPPEPRSSTRGEVGPVAARRRATVANPSAWRTCGSSGPGPEEAGLTGLGEDVGQRGGGVTPLVGARHRRGVSPRAAMTMWRLGSSPSERVTTPGISLTASCTALRSAGLIVSSAFS